MSEKISVIIPVYKVQDYLPKCIESVLGQTYQNLEIILIDDGSPDQCGAICDAYAAKDARIHVIHKENEGVARARNDGIAYATGDYISFIDSDDWIAKDAYELLYQGLKEYGADCCVGGCVTVIEKDGTLKAKKNQYQPVFCETSTEAMKRVLLNGSAVWNRLFKREVFEEIRFPADRINDDEVVALHAYAECEKIVFLDRDTYYYRIRQNSITTSGFSRRDMDYYYNSRENLAFVSEVRPELRECAEFKYMKAMLYCYINLRKIKKDPETEELKKSLRKDIKKHRKAAWKNQYMSLPLKILAVIA